MKAFYVLIFSLFATANALSFMDLYGWFLYKMKHSKSYPNLREDGQRMNTYFANRRIIDEHNLRYDAGQVTYRMGLNEFSDLSHEEFVSRMNGAKRPPPTSNGETLFTVPFNGSALGAPQSMDWRRKGAVSDVKNQGRCGSCWAFSAVGAIEAHQFLKTGRMVSLSEQNLLDCSRIYGSRGCQGGWMHQAFNYVQRNGGIDTEQSYPYRASSGVCRYNPWRSGATIRGAVSIPEGDEQQLMEAIGTAGPVSVSIDASHPSFQHYHSGIYQENDCSEHNVDHAVLAVGYGTDDRGNDYYLVKNSWGKTWGEDGYVRLARTKKNHCGIASAALYPLI